MHIQMNVHKRMFLKVILVGQMSPDVTLFGCVTVAELVVVV